jgi:transposase
LLYSVGMKETLAIETERIDDIPLLLAHMQHMELANLLDKHRIAFEQKLMGNLIRVYDMQKDCVRIDTTTIKSYAKVNEQGLLQLGLSLDHRPDLGQLKIALASLDPLGMPLATEVLSGECADDPVYEPIIARVRDGTEKTGLLYVGDCKMAALQTRASIQLHGDFYLCPLSAVQVPPDQIWKEVDKLKEQGTQIIKVERLNSKEERVCIAQGYETHCDLTAEVNGQREEWTERRFLVQSTSGAEAAMYSLLESKERSV